MVPREKLETLDDLLRRYIFLTMYWKECDIAPNKDIVLRALRVKKLFQVIPDITNEVCDSAIASLSTITYEMVLGITPQQRDATIEIFLKNAEQSFEKMKECGCTKAEAEDTVDTIKYLRKLNETPLIPCPQIATKELVKMKPATTNSNVPNNTIRLVLRNISSAVGNPTLYFKWYFQYAQIMYAGESETVSSF